MRQTNDIALEIRSIISFFWLCENKTSKCIQNVHYNVHYNVHHRCIPVMLIFSFLTYDELVVVRKLSKEFRNRQGVSYDRLLDRFTQRLSYARNTSIPTTCSFLLDCLVHEDKESITLWANSTYTKLRAIEDLLESQVNPSRPATLVDYDKYIGTVFEDSNPSMKDLIIEANTDA